MAVSGTTTGFTRPRPGVDRSEISAGKRTPVAVNSAFLGHCGVRTSDFHLWATCVSHVGGLTLGLAGLVFGVIAFAASRTRHETSGGQELYRYPPMVGWLMAICGVFFLCIPLLPGRGDVPPLAFFAFFAAFAACAFAAAIYFFRFRVIVDETEFKFGTLRFETIPFAEVVDIDVTAGPRSNLLVYLRDGRRLQFSNMLGDFTGLTDSLGARKAGSAPGTGASLQKLNDQRRRATIERALRWIVCVAVAGGFAYWVVAKLL